MSVGIVRQLSLCSYTAAAQALLLLYDWSVYRSLALSMFYSKLRLIYPEQLHRLLCLNDT